MARSQVTMFIVVALVILIVFVAMVLIISPFKEHRLRVSKEELQRVLTSEGKYHTYITSCLDQATKKALLLLGSQGGVIYTTQANNTKFFLSHAEGTSYLPFQRADLNGSRVTYNVNYGIHAPRLGGVNHPQPPTYPYPGQLVADPQKYNPSLTYIFGNYPQPGSLTPLCDSLGLNMPIIADATYSCGSYETSYDSNDTTNFHSIQEYLQQYIKEQTVKCIRLEDLPELIGWNITRGDANVIVAFSDDSVFSFLNYSLQLQRGSEQEALTLDLFNDRVPVRLRQIHELLHELIREDTNNIFFNSITDVPLLNRCTNLSSFSSTLCFKSGMSLVKFRNVCPSCTPRGQYDDILMLEDTASFIDGKPYQFYLAIENRIPALNYIRNTKHINLALPDKREALLVFPGEDLKIDPYAYDPDEDDHNLGYMEHGYYYAGWRENYVDQFDAATWSSQDSAMRYLHLESFTPVLQRQYTNPKNFSTSPQFITTSRSASFTVADSDYGLHTVTVGITDDGQLKDWQDVLVYVPPAGEILSYHLYPDIPPTVTSLEDELTIQASLTAEQQNTGQNFEWDVSGQQFSGNNANLIIGLPSQPPLTTGPKTVNLVVKDSRGTVIAPNFNSLIIDVASCLPHRSLAPPYPFNTFALEPYKEPNEFLANHTCCEGDPADDPIQWKKSDQDKICYEKTFVGTYNEASVPIEDTLGKISGGVQPLILIPPTLTEDQTKLYKRTITYKCGSGTSYQCLQKDIDTIEELP